GVVRWGWSETWGWGALLGGGHQWVKMRTRVQQPMQAIALKHGLRQGRGIGSAEGQSALRALPLPPHTAPRRNELIGTMGNSRSGSRSSTKRWKARQDKGRSLAG